jgi:thioesterase domain-containing protein
LFRHHDQVQLQLLLQWRAILGSDDLPLTESFPALGGTPARAAALQSSIERDFGVSISPEAHPTIEAMAEVLRTALRARGPRPTPLRIPPFVDGDVPLVLVHSVSGELNHVQRFTRSEIGRSVIGLQAPGLDLEEEPYGDVEGLAARHVADLLGSEVGEPFAIAGFSDGALIAFAMACRLEAQGREVAYLGLFEPWEADGTSEVKPVQELVDERLRELCFFYEVDADPRDLEQCLRALQRAGAVLPGYSLELLQRSLELYAGVTRMCRAYTTELTYKGHAVLYESRDAGCGDRPTGRLDEGACAYERFWLDHLPPDTLVRRQRCPHRSLYHTAETRRCLRDDVFEALRQDQGASSRDAEPVRK